MWALWAPSMWNVSLLSVSGVAVSLSCVRVGLHNQIVQFLLLFELTSANLLSLPLASAEGMQRDGTFLDMWRVSSGLQGSLSFD